MPWQRCLDCYHFKTRVANRKNLKSFPYPLSAKVIKVIKRQNHCRVFYCALFRQARMFYIDPLDCWDRFGDLEAPPLGRQRLVTILHLRQKNCFFYLDNLG